MTTSSRRREFLRAAVSALTSVGLPTAHGSSAWGDAPVTTNPSQEASITQSDVDGLRLGRASAEECQGRTVLVPFSAGSEETLSPGGIVLDMFRSLRGFCKEARRGDIVRVRLGTGEVLGVGEIADDAAEWLDAFADVDGWNLQHDPVI